MKILEKIKTNKIGIVFVIFHFILLVCSVPFLAHPPRDEMGLGVLLGLLVLMSDLPAIAVAALLCLPLNVFPVDRIIYYYGMFVVSFFTIILQWLFIGKIFSNIFNPNKSKPILIFLNDK